MQNINTKIQFEYINFNDEQLSSIFDLANPQHYQAVVLSLGNGIIEEARIVGTSKAAVFLFVNLIERGGYKRNNIPKITDSKLYFSGDACFPEVESFIFVSPNTEDGERIDFENYEQEMNAFIEANDLITD